MVICTQRFGNVAPARWCESEICKPPSTPSTPSTLLPMIRNLASSIRVARHLSVTPSALAALVFRMPAMSPTMTEGGIVSWKLKSGEEFAAGDVLLEVETDKATIDVEAQDDGIMWEILENDGATGVVVGKPIALLAEPGDDLATLEKPALEEATEAPAKKEEPKKEEPKKEAKPEPKQESKPQASAPADSSSDSVFVKANPNLRFFPSVELTLHKHGISNEDAYANIPASGPQGRILVGDVLAYLGEIDKSAITKVTQYIKSKEHLDLSNIKLAAPKAAAPEAAKPEKAEKPKPTNILSIEFTSELGEGVSKEKFQYAFERALEGAKRQTYAARFPEYARSPSASSLYEDDIFDDLLSAPVTKDRFSVYDVSYQFIGESSGFAAPVDSFDDLLGLPTTSSATFEADGPISAIVSFKVKFDDKLTDSKDFVEFFQDSLLSQIPSKQLIIHS